MNETRRLGWRPDPPKAAGQKPDLLAAARLGLAPPPARASARHLVLDVLDQGGLSSCVANAGFQAVRASHVLQGALWPPLGSRLMGYYLARAYEGPVVVDAGTYIRDFFRALNRFGYAPETAWSYNQDAVNIAPGTDAFRLAFDQKAPTEYFRVGADRLTECKRAVAAGHLVVFGTPIAEDFFGDDGKTPILPPEGKKIAGGHAMCLAGYDEDGFDVVNSWGVEWGKGGWCRFSNAYVEWEGTQDLWICQSAPRFSA